MPDSLFDPLVQSVLTGPQQPFPSPVDWRDLWIYLLFVDRFNNPASPPLQPPFDAPTKGFQGGSYAGVREKLPYLKNLGVCAIWLAPVLKNLPFSRTYHGYGIHDFLSAEPRFASDPLNADAELRQLVDAAHALGIYVIFDIVLNHTGDAFAYDGLGSRAPHSATPLPIHWRDATGTPTFPDLEAIASPPRQALVWPREMQKTAFYRRQGGVGSDGLIGDFASLKQFRTEDANLQNLFLRAYEYVIARFDCDGFRIDTLRYLQGDLPRLFGNAMREFAASIGKKNFFTFGEVFDQRAEEDIARFIGRNTRDASELVGVDAAMDYPLFFHLPNVMKGLEPPQALVDMYSKRKQIETNIVSSHGEATRFFVTFLDNHDTKARFYHVDPANPHRLDDQVTGALAFLLSLQGIPCIYYGSEQGLHGAGGDDEVREALWGKPDAFDETHPFFLALQAIAKVRAREPALRYGRQYFRPISGSGRSFGVSKTKPGIAAFSRLLAMREAVVVANVAETDHAVYVIVDTALHPVGATFEIAYSNRAAPTPPEPVVELGAGGTITVQEADGSTSKGPVHAIRVSLQGRETQILTPKL